MESDLSNQPTIERPWSHYALAALALLVGLFLLTTIGLRGKAAGERPADSTSLFAGDWNIKVYLFLSYVQKQGALPAQVNREEVLAQAVTTYKRAAEAPSPPAIRRYAISLHALRGVGELQVIDRLDSPEVLRDRAHADQMRLEREVLMWKHIYTGQVKPEDVEQYAARIRELPLGPVESLALAQLYASVGREDRAEEVIGEAQERAVVSVIAGGILIFVLFAAAVAGVGFIAIFLRRYREELTGPTFPTEGGEERETPAQGGREPADAVVLLKSFIVYVGAVWVLSLVLGLTLGPSLTRLPARTRLTYTIALEFSGSALSGLIALLVLYLLLRKTGKGLGAIGLTTRDFGRNVLWGIAGYCALLPVLLVAMVISSILFRGIRTPEHPLIPMLISGDRTIFTLLFFFGAVFAPFFEEIFFRGVLYNALRARINVVLAAVLSSAAFAVVHPQLPAGFLPIFSIGAVFALLVEVRRSLVPSIVAHAINNGVLFLMMYLALLL
ncbi:MAG: CPBP family intramembrane metalloprotease [Armatimonadetes bacterium]|nr:CPBP family intramembrane metalloprotease [Armatimonadota bacterium]